MSFCTVVTTTAHPLLLSGRVRRPAGVGMGTAVAFPADCTFDTNVGRYDASRTTTCVAASVTTTAYAEPGHQLSGTSILTAWEYWQTDPTTLAIATGLALRVEHIDGVFGVGDRISVDDDCGFTLLPADAGCSLTAAAAPNGPLSEASQLNDVVGNQWTETYSLGSSTRLTDHDYPSEQYIEINIAPAGATGISNSTHLSGSQPFWRCDTEDQDTPPGCINPGFIPTLTFDATGNPLVRGVAEHVADAQQQRPAHEGLQGFGLPLHRTTNATRNANRRAACANFGKASPILKSCDEFPLASSAEGGLGASTRAVSVSAQNSQGGLTQGFYATNRVLPPAADSAALGDPFWVATILRSFPTTEVALPAQPSLPGVLPTPVPVGDGVVVGVGRSVLWQATFYPGSAPAVETHSTWGSIGLHATAGDGSVWFIEDNGNSSSPQTKFARYDPSSHEVSEYDGPSRLISAITTGGDGNIYFTEYTPDPASTGYRVGVINPDGSYDQFLTGITLSSAAVLTTATDGTVWFAGANDYGTLNANGITFEASNPLGGSDYDFNPGSLVSDSAGAVWLINQTNAEVYSISPHHVITDHPITLPVPTDYAAPDNIISASDGSVWIGMAAETSDSSTAKLDGYLFHVRYDGSTALLRTGIKINVTPSNGPAHAAHQCHRPGR